MRRIPNLRPRATNAPGPNSPTVVGGNAMTTTTTRYWHGGAPGLKAGDLIEPRPDDDQRHLRDGCPTCEARRRGEQLADDLNDASRVYVTTDREYARVFAAGYGDGSLYRVEPIGELTPTEDDPAPSWSCHAARVLSVYDALVRFTPQQAQRALRRWSA